MAHAAKLYPTGKLHLLKFEDLKAKIYLNLQTGYIIMAMVGTIKGNGAAFMRLIERILRGVWTPNAVEIMQPTL